MKIKEKKIYKIIVNMLIIMMFLMLCSVSAYANPSDDDSIIMEPEENSFTIDVEFNNIDEPFASAEFEITISDVKEIKAEAMTFDDGIKSKASGTVDTILSGGKADGIQVRYKAGFLSAENQFSGKLKVGTITFTYTGTTPQTIRLDNLEIIRLTGNLKDGLPELKKTAETWNKTITVSRGEATEEKAAAPVAHPLPGEYDTNTEITLTSDTKGSIIYYTLDGSSPTKSSTLYSKPILLDKAMVIKAFAAKEGYMDSSIVTFSYTVTSGTTDPGEGGGTKPGGSTQTPTAPETPPAGPVVFGDVNKDDWFYDAVQYVYAKGLMKGTGTDPMMFSPHATTTRGMVVTILYRLEGSPAVTATNPFNDVAKEQYYAEPIIWASSNKIVSGYGNSLFGPNDHITREQMAVILMNYAKFKGYDVSAKANLATFNDYTSVSQWALDAISWANAKGLIQGSNNNLMPGGNAERCQVAAILQRFMEMN